MRHSVGQAKTGTGKTIAFLLPMAQRAITENPHLAHRSSQRVRSDDICGIIISPTRELAEQIAVEAKRITARTGLKVQLAVGGTQKNQMLERARYEGCHLLVGTPGRIQDLLSDEYSGIKAPNLNTLVLDEADRLLDVGFGPAIEEIKRSLPDPRDRTRQNMLFSATISHEVVDLVRHTLQPGFKFVQCVDPNEELTHQNVKQQLALLPGFENRVPALLELIDREIRNSEEPGARPFKAMVFYNATSETQFAAEVLNSHFRQLGRDSSLSNANYAALPRDFRTLEIHGQLSQSQRTRVSEAFRQARTAVLITTDVTARGLDFPNVTHIIQMGVPVQNPRETYIHRLGRTARAGKEGEGWLFVTDIEAPMAKKYLLGLPLSRNESLKTLNVDLVRNPEIPVDVQHFFDDAKKGTQRVHPEIMSAVYVNALRSVRVANKRDVIARANFYAKVEWGQEEPPAISAKIANSLGVGQYDGVRIRQDYGGRGGGGRGGFDRQSGGFGGGGNGNRGGSDPFSRDSRGGSRGGDRGGSRGGSFGGSRGGGFGGGRRNDPFGSSSHGR
jgi:ATP-dependent RNA helicase MSS116, mitochondrial